MSFGLTPGTRETNNSRSILINSKEREGEREGTEADGENIGGGISRVRESGKSADLHLGDIGTGTRTRIIIKEWRLV